MIGTAPGAVATGLMAPVRYRSRRRTGDRFPVHTISSRHRRLWTSPTRTSPQLSSSFTLAHKWILPAGFLLGWPLWIWSALRGPSGEWIGAIFWSFWCAYWLIWSWPIERVTVEGDYFLISNYFTSCRVPVANLASIVEIRDDRTSAITLYFEPPTPFGRRVRIIPPTGLFVFDRESFDEVAAFLRSVINDRERP